MDIRKLEAEIKHLNRLVILLQIVLGYFISFKTQNLIISYYSNYLCFKILSGTSFLFWKVDLKESDSQRLRMMLKLRDEKLKRLHMLADDLVPSDGYMVEENAAMSQEIQLLQKQFDENPQLTQFAFENKRLIEQVRT